VSFYREPGAPMFDETDKVFVERLALHLARGARTALLFGEAIDPESPDAPGLLMLNEAFKVQSATAEAARWLAELPDGDSVRGRLPASVLAVAGAALDARSPRADLPPADVGLPAHRTGTRRHEPDSARVVHDADRG
jgi:hypothetical protein